jgi:rubrerythrin
MLNEQAYQQRTAAFLRAGESAANRRYEAELERHDRFVDALDSCETLDDLHRVFDDALRRCRTNSDVFERYEVDGNAILVCEDCGRVVDPDESQNQNLIDECPHCGYSPESDEE